MADLYATLGIARGADDAAIKKSYRKLAKEYHPDRNQDNPKAAERFAEITNVYDLLSDKTKRAQYDRGEIDEQGNPKSPFGFGGGSAGRGGAGPGGMRFEGDNVDFSDIFGDIFGGARQRSQSAGYGGFRQPPRKGPDRQYRLSITLDDAAALKPQRITLASGNTIDVKLPVGVETGTQMRLAGKGDPGPAANGDALLTIEILPHRYFKKDGDDIRIDLPITLREAVLGEAVKVPTVDGAVMLTIPAGSTSGKVLRLKGRGFHKKAGGRGDQLVTLMIDIPKGDETLERFVDDWQDKGRNPRASLGV